MAPPNNRRSLFQRNRGKLMLAVMGTAALFTTGSIIMYLVKQWLYRQHQRLSEERFAREQIRRRFIQTQEDSLRTVSQLTPVLAIVLNNDGLDIDTLFGELKNKKNKKGETSQTTEDRGEGTERSKTKAELWDELKVNSLVKLVTIIYTVSSLFMLTRLQLNMLARREYLETAINMDKGKKSDEKSSHGILAYIGSWWSQGSPEESPTNDNNPISMKSDKTTYTNEQAFLSLSWWLLNEGYKKYSEMARKYVLQEFASINPTDKLSVLEFSERLSAVFQGINRSLLVTGQDNTSLQDILLPGEENLYSVLQQSLDTEALLILQEDDIVLRRLVHETSQYLESTASTVVIERLLNKAYQYSMNSIDSAIQSKRANNDRVNDATNLEAASHQMALLAIVVKDTCRELVSSSPANSLGNEFLRTLDCTEEMNDLSSSVYSNFNI